MFLLQMKNIFESSWTKTKEFVPYPSTDSFVSGKSYGQQRGQDWLINKKNCPF